jgi:hypothetical protein
MPGDRRQEKVQLLQLGGRSSCTKRETHSVPTGLLALPRLLVLTEVLLCV